MALRRQAGADTVYLDTVDSYAHYALQDPQSIDFADIEKAAYDAAYDITEIRLDLKGEVVEHACDSCNGAQRQFLRMSTGQEFELRGSTTGVGTQSIRAVVVDWAGEHPRLSVQ
ncbi:MAG: hypothetical protein ACPG31_00940 [Planctomycetota bacterium]